MKSAILFLCFSGIVMGNDETCTVKGEYCAAPEDDGVELLQARTQVHQKMNTDMPELLAAFEKEAGPASLQQLVQGVMTIPFSNKGEAILAAVHAQPQLQYLAKQHPHLVHTLGLFENPKAVQLIKEATVFKAQPSAVKMWRHKTLSHKGWMPPLAQLLGKKEGGQKQTQNGTNAYQQNGFEEKPKKYLITNKLSGRKMFAQIGLPEKKTQKGQDGSVGAAPQSSDNWADQFWYITKLEESDSGSWVTIKNAHCLRYLSCEVKSSKFPTGVTVRWKLAKLPKPRWFITKAESSGGNQYHFIQCDDSTNAMTLYASKGKKFANKKRWTNGFGVAAISTQDDQKWSIYDSDGNGFR